MFHAAPFYLLSALAEMITANDALFDITEEMCYNILINVDGAGI